MIPLKIIPWQSDAWTHALADAITNPHELLAHLELTERDVDFAPDFPLRVPHSFVERMRVGDPDDPLLRQVLPTLAERESMLGYSTDPLEEAAATRAPGVIQKYHGRVLLIAAPACAVHCRYCFRRTFPYCGPSAGDRVSFARGDRRGRDHHRGDPVRRGSVDVERRAARAPRAPPRRYRASQAAAYSHAPAGRDSASA